MLSHTRMGVPYEYTHMGRPMHTRMGQYTHMGQNRYTVRYKILEGENFGEFGQNFLVQNFLL